MKPWSRPFCRLSAVVCSIVLAGLAVPGPAAAAAGSVVSGVVTDSAGAPIAGAQVAAGSIAGSAFGTTDAAGHYALQVAPGSYDFTVRVDAYKTGYTGTAAAQQLRAEERTLSVDGDTINNITLPQMTALRVTVLDNAGQPVPNTRLQGWAGVQAYRTTENGTAIEFYYDNTECTTDHAGTCALPAILAGNSIRFQAYPPNGQSELIDTTAPTDPTDYTLQLAGYGVVQSEGTMQGDVVVSVSAGLTLTDLSTSPSAAVDGQAALVGAVSYQVSGMAVGTSVDVTLTLPAGSKPSSVYKFVDGMRADAASHAAISGDTIVLHVVDGGWGDADGTANGVIVDPVIPARAIDAVPPSVHLTGPAAAFTLGSSATVSWSGSDSGSGLARYQVRYQQAAFNSGFTGWQYPRNWSSLTNRSAHLSMSPGRTYCFSARAIDKAGNASAWTAARCTERPLDDSSLVRSAGWTRRSNAAYYLGTATRTSRHGATLIKGPIVLDRLAIVATRCPTCGAVGVYLGSRYIGKVNLHSVRTQHRVIIQLPRFTLRRATVTLKVVSIRKTVQIEGLAASPR